ncbi:MULTISPECIES: hypothetical protein [unclassified Janthinobacterium]|uniref:hypothetical protein n=1 Tax=unclassified Janthinobacterium TaxID=2610881 RepID=UPI0012FBE64B|nr:MULTISPECIES: hypothetical protein [unclassified Janthinobacterium]
MQERNEYAALFSGSLDAALSRHAADRILHFFFFCFYVEITCDYLAIYNVCILPKDAISPHATHQVDKGVRNKAMEKLDVYSSAPANLTVTGHGSMDAAHTNNLGLTDPFVRACEKYAISDQLLGRLYTCCENFCSNTTLLPQSINLGPDKVVDQVHRDMYNEIFSMSSKKPRITEGKVCHYLNHASNLLQEMAIKKVEKNVLAETAGYYIAGINSVVHKIVEIVGDEADLVVSAINTHIKSNRLVDALDYVASPKMQQRVHESPTRFRQPGYNSASVAPAVSPDTDVDMGPW